MFIDPALRDKRGHNFDYARLIIADAKAAGFECHIFAHANSVIDAHELGCPVERYFARAHTDSPLADIAARSFKRVFGDRVYRLTRSVRRAVAPTAVPADAKSSVELSRARIFLNEARKLFSRLAPTDRDRIFLPNLIWSEAALLAQLLASEDVTGSADIQILMRFDPPVGEVSKRALAKAGETKAITWLADTDELVESYAELLQSNVLRAPVPIDGPALRRAALARPSPDPVVVVALGESRREKGFLLLPEIIARVLQKDTAIRFEIQTSLNMRGGEPGIGSAIAALRRMQGPNLTLLPPQLSSDQFAGVLGTAHILLMPYEASSYSKRSSGLLLHGLAAGLWIVMPEAAVSLLACVVRNRRQEQAILCKLSIDNYISGLCEAIARVREKLPPPTPPMAEECIPPPWRLHAGISAVS
ncbi:MAG: hypothetical protein ABMA14_00055 [Hyphomonadaceae bacterium]